MPNTKDLRPDATTTIVISPPKHGKTYALRSWPKPIYIASFDGGIAPLAGDDCEYEIFYDKDRYAPKAYPEFEKWYNDLIGKIERKEIVLRTLVLDNITFMSKHVLNYIQFTSRTVDKPAGYEGYRSLLNKGSDIIVKAKADSKRLGFHLVVTAESKTEKDELTGEVETVPAIEGQYRDFIVAEFDFAFYGKVGRDPKDPRLPRYFWQTVPDHRIKCAGARWDCGLSPEEEPNFANVIRKIEQKFPHVRQQQQQEVR